MKGYSPESRSYWMIVLSLGLASMLIFAVMYSVQPLLPLYTEEFNISISAASLTMSLPTISLIAGLIILGFLSDRHGRVLFIKLSVFLSLLTFICIPFTHSFGMIAAIRFVQGFMLAGVPAAALAYIAEEIDAKYSALATAFYISCNALGGMIGRVVTAYVSEHQTWQHAIFYLSTFGAVVCIFVFFALPKSKNFSPGVRKLKTDFLGFYGHMKNPLLLLMFGLGITLQMSFTGMWTYLPFHLTEPPYGMSLDTISALYFAYGFGIIGAPTASYLSNRFSLQSLRNGAIVVLLVGLALTLNPAVPGIIAGLCIACFGFFTAHSLTASTVSSTAQTQKGLASSLYLVSYYIGVASGSTLLSPIWSSLNWNGLVIFTIAVPLFYTLFLHFSLKKRPSEM